MRNTLIKLIFASFAGIAATAAPLAHAQAQTPAPARPAAGNIEFKNIAEVEIETKTADGKVEKKRGPVQKAVPGTVIFYTSTFKNISAKPAGNIVITNPIPANTPLVAASPYGEGMDISYSADGAKTWAAVDTDNASFTAGAVAVVFGNTAAPATRVIEFKATVN